MNCPKCGQKTGDEDKFCPKCGAAIPKQELVPEQFTATEPVQLQWAATTVQVKPKTPKTKIYIIAASVALVIALSIISYVMFNASPEYRGAVSLMKSGLYSEAAVIFTTIDPEYKDVDEKLAVCNAMISYQQATDLMTSGSYAEAADIFVSLGDFKNSAQLAQTCTNDATYQEAVACMQSGDYETAKIKLTALGNFEDSKTQLAECEKGIQYNQAAALLKGGQSEQAKEIFLSLGDFKDSAQMAENCNQSAAYDRAKALYEKGDYEAAKTAFEALGDYSDAKAMSTKCQNYIDYNKAVSLMNSGDKAGAEKMFTSLGSFKDSKSLALDCKYSADYEKAKTYMQQGNYTEAAKLFQTLASANYKDSKTLLADCQKGPATSSSSQTATSSSASSPEETYKHAVRSYQVGHYYTAYKLFNSILSYKDASSYVQKCIRPIPSNASTAQTTYNWGDCLLTIKTTYNKNTYIKVFSGLSVSFTTVITSSGSVLCKLPPGDCIIKIAFGDKWFGGYESFGDDGSYYVVKNSNGFYKFNVSPNTNLTVGPGSSCLAKISYSDFKDDVYFNLNIQK